MRLNGATNSSYSGTFNGGSFNPNGPYTLAFWARPTTDPPSTEYVVKLSNAGGGQIGLHFLANGDIAMRDERNSGFTNLGSVYSSFPFSAWTHWAFTYDGSYWSLYLDGNKIFDTTGFGPVVITGRAALTTVSITTDAQATSDFNVSELFVFDQALIADQIRGLRVGSWPVVGTTSSHVFGWWKLNRTFPSVDRSQTNSPFTTGTIGPQLDWSEKRFVDGSSWWRRLILPQYLLQPPIAATAGNRTNVPSATLTVSQALTFGAAATTTNAPNAVITASAIVASTASAVSNAPSSTITAAAPVVSSGASAAATKTDAPSAGLVSRPVVASTAAAVSNAPTATINPSYPIVSVAGAVSGASAAVSASATIASVAAAVTNVPAANIAGGMASTASTTTDAPAVTLQRNLPIISAAGATTNSTAAIGASAPVASTAANVTNAPSATISPTGTVVSVVATVSNCPSAVVTTTASIACVSATVTNCPSAALLAGRFVFSTASTTSNCPPADIVPLVFKSIASVCTTVTDCPAIPFQGLFKDLVAPPIQQRRQWPPRPR